MRVKVKPYMAFKQALGAEQLELELPAGSTVRTLLEALAARAGAVARALARPEEVLVLRNRVRAGLDEPLQEGDEVFLSPKLSTLW